jgi:hypothetical protein
VAELREILTGRDDGPALLAQVAGLLTGFHAGDDLYEAKARAAAHFCIAAGADESLIPQWAEEGKRRAEARRMPHSASRLGVHRGAADRGCQPAQDRPEPQTWH